MATTCPESLTTSTLFYVVVSLARRADVPTCHRKGHTDVGNCQNDEKHGKENDKTFGKQELFLHSKLLLKDSKDLDVVGKVSTSFGIQVAHGLLHFV